MKNKMLYKLRDISIYCSLILILVSSFGCQEKGDCSKFLREEYFDEQVDSTVLKSALEFRDTLLNWFSETPIKGQNHGAYHLLYYSAFGIGKSIKFEKKYPEYFLTVKCWTKHGAPPTCESYQRPISSEDWDKLEEMIYEFNFWTEKRFKRNEDVLDGYVYFLEGNRPEAGKCDKKTYQFVGRASIPYDKIIALSDWIGEYEYRFSPKWQSSL